jgi:hypothetical protein
MCKPFFGIIFGDNGPLSDFSTAEAPRLEFFICSCSAKTVGFTELTDAHSPLASASPLLSFRDFLIVVHCNLAMRNRIGPGDRVRTLANDDDTLR